MAASISKSTLLVEKLSLSDSEKDLAKIRDHAFSHAVSVILPGENALPHFVLETFVDQFTYRLQRLPLFHFIEMPFVHAFVRKGAISLISINRKLDTDDCATITNDGLLLLSLTKDTYQQLGLEAMKQTPSQRKQDIYVVKINLLQKSFKSGKKCYDRILWCLKDRLDLVMDFLVSWVPNDENVCSSSIGAYFVDKCDKVERIDLQRTSRQCASLQWPKIDYNQPKGSETSCHFRDVFEWLGVLECDITTDESIDTYVSTLRCPEPNTNIPHCCMFQASSLITSHSILKLWKALRHHSLQTHNYPVCLTVHGFSDSIMRNKHDYNSFYVAGDNIYILLLLSENQCWYYSASGS
ncbi:hypothetical protein Btru_006726 [Bulinus truncatus]|nr:hypothetical protein Btru_006726 [Bulinus truncatus]